MTDDNIESIWRQTMRSSADNAPMVFARALVAAERERWREITRRAAKDGNRYGLEGIAATCEPSEAGGVLTWTMEARA